MIAMKAINFFDDIDENIDPPKLLKPLPLKKITARIQEATQKPDKYLKQIDYEAAIQYPFFYLYIAFLLMHNQILMYCIIDIK